MGPDGVPLPATGLQEWGRSAGIGPVHSFKVRAALLAPASYHILGEGLPKDLMLVFDTKRNVLETPTQPGHFFWTLLAKTPSVVGTVEQRTTVESPDVWRNWLGMLDARGTVMASLQVTRDRDPSSNLIMREEDSWMVSGEGKSLTLHHVRDETPPNPRYVSLTAANILPKVSAEIYSSDKHLIATAKDADIRVNRDRWLGVLRPSSTPPVYPFVHLLLVFCAWWVRLS